MVKLAVYICIFGFIRTEDIYFIGRIPPPFRACISRRRVKANLVFTMITHFGSIIKVIIILYVYGYPHNSLCEYHSRCDNYIVWWSW